VPDETCMAFDSVAPFGGNVLHRFVVGADPAPRAMSPAEVKKLADPFASLLLARGVFPRSGEEVLARIKAAVPKGSPLKLHSSFVLGEGSQLASTPESAGVDRTMRFVVTVGTGPNGPDVMFSVPDPKQRGLVELMAWDRKVGGFNYYRSTGNGSMWMFAGNSRDALREASRRKGVFESHRSGAPLMLELKTPWTNWHSPAANIPQTAFAANDPRRTHNWFVNKEPGGALTFELEAAQPAMTRWAKARFAKLRQSGGTVTRPRVFMEQILDSPTVNLTSTHIESNALSPADRLDLPATFFVDAEGLSDILGLASPPAFTVNGRIYAKCLEKFDVRMDDGEGFTVKGDTHFCFLVPERAFEDQVVLREVVEMGLVSRRLAACLLMVDPWNPVFSDRRRALLSHVPSTATIAKGKSTFTRDMANAILAAATTAPAGAPEKEFAARWQTGIGFAAAFNTMLRSYYAAVTAKLKTQAGFEAFFKLAADRRQDFRDKTSLAEFPLLLPHTNIPAGTRTVKPDGTVVGA
jgi:hypothetical protein